MPTVRCLFSKHGWRPYGGEEEIEEGEEKDDDAERQEVQAEDNDHRDDGGVERFSRRCVEDTGSDYQARRFLRRTD
jgi:hypothetical protein